MDNRYMDAGSIPIYTLNDGKTCSNFVAELAKEIGNVTINPNALKDILKYGRLIGNYSVFNEITWVNPDQDIKKSKVNIPFLPHLFDVDFWANKIIYVLKSWFLQNLNSDEEYWLLHSSGGDSRILSAILFTLRKENNFTPNLKFVSWFPEAKQSEKILNFIGYNKSDYWLVGDDKPENLVPDKYWNESNYFNFNDCGYVTNGEIHPWGVSQSNFWKPYYKNVKNINVIMAMIGDMVMGAHSWPRWGTRFIFNTNSLKYSSSFKRNILIGASARYNGLGLLGYVKDFKKLYTPTMEFPCVNIGLQIPYSVRYNDNVRKRIQEILFPGLSSIPNIGKSWAVCNNDSILFNEIINQIKKTYFYGSIGKNFTDNDLIKFLSLSSLIEKLHISNVNVRNGS